MKIMLKKNKITSKRIAIINFKRKKTVTKIAL